MLKGNMMIANLLKIENVCSLQL